MNKINWKIRFQNPLFVAMFVMSIILPIVSYCGMQPEEITSWAILFDMLFDAIQNPYLLALIICNAYNAIIDPTTQGMKDSQLVLDKLKQDDHTIDLEQIEEIFNNSHNNSEG